MFHSVTVRHIFEQGKHRRWGFKEGQPGENPIILFEGLSARGREDRVTRP